ILLSLENPRRLNLRQTGSKPHVCGKQILVSSVKKQMAQLTQLCHHLEQTTTVGAAWLVGGTEYRASIRKSVQNCTVCNHSGAPSPEIEAARCRGRHLQSTPYYDNDASEKRGCWVQRLCLESS